MDHAGITTKLTNHVGRHSMATIFLELGGSVEVLQPIMGHTKITTTMRYAHVRDQRKAEQMGISTCWIFKLCKFVQRLPMGRLEPR